MRRKLVYTLSCLILLHSLACNNDREIDGLHSEGVMKSIKLNIALDSYSTRSADLPYNDGDAVALDIERVKVFTYDQINGGNQVFEEIVEFSRNSQSGGSTSYSATISCPDLSRRVKVVFNSDNLDVTGVGTLSSDVNSRQGGSDKTVVQVSGEAVITLNNEATISASAEMARIQIVDDIKTPTVTEPTIYKNLTLQAVYINNTIIERGGVKTLTADANINTVYGVTGSKKSLFDELKDASNVFNCTITDIDGNYTLTDMENTHYFTRKAVSIGYPKPVVGGALRGEAIGYNLFPQGSNPETDITIAGENLPFVILKIGYTEKSEGGVWKHVDVINGLPTDDGDANNNFTYLKVIAFDNNTSTYPAYEAGKVYEFSMNDILQLITTPTAPLDPIIKLKVTIKEWVKQEHDLTPEPPEIIE